MLLTNRNSQNINERNQIKNNNDNSYKEKKRTHENAANGTCSTNQNSQH